MAVVGREAVSEGEQEEGSWRESNAGVRTRNAARCVSNSKEVAKSWRREKIMGLALGVVFWSTQLAWVSIWSCRLVRSDMFWRALARVA